MKRADFKEDGCAIDNTCYPNIAYKGPRMKPTELWEIPTEREELQNEFLQDFIDMPMKGPDFDPHAMVKLKIKIKRHLPNQ